MKTCQFKNLKLGFKTEIVKKISLRERGGGILIFRRIIMHALAEPSS